MHRSTAVVSFLTAALALACATSPTGRQRLVFFPDAQMNQMGVTAFTQLKSQMTVSNDPQAIAYVKCVASAVVAEIDTPGAPRSWEVVVFDEPSANAFALPGGKIGVHTGMLEVARNQDQLATVIGHEVAHVLAGHSNERASTELATKGAMGALDALTGPASPTKDLTFAVLGVGAQVGVLLPFSRAQESEADVLGLDLMARAGFDPREGPVLWENMARQGAQPPEILSTHPSSATRIANLRQRAEVALPLFREAHKSGRVPDCS
jgi:predicted Zn-dependent protease